ncbi:MAG TPA: VWA domain-containing protein [Ruminococcaceae bacterium]|nr:VWA domain-containing protein [Oscillospiraceae bacterium]
MSKNKKTFIIFILIAVLVFGGTFGIITLINNSGGDREVTEEDAVKDMEKLYKKIHVNTLEPIKDNVDLSAADIQQALPDISKYPPQVDESTENYVEIFSSTEKATVSAGSGADNDRWLVDMAQAFNSSGASVNGQSVSVRIRGIASGLGVDYIASGKYLPDAFSPSNELWGDMLESYGVNIKMAEKKLTGNVAGIVLTKTEHDKITEKYGGVTVESIIKAVSGGEIAMGYTNPFASSTGANFLISTLYTFNSQNPLAEDAKGAFEDFQTNIPYVAYTTLQMKESAASGALNGFVFEYQQYMNTPEFKASYVFTPFGVRHDSPVYEIGELSDMKKQILRQFIDFCKTDESQAAAAEKGFNGHDDYVCDIPNISGKALPAAQKLWKEKKTGNREIIAVFVADISGSMSGDSILRLKESLLTGSKFINAESSIGLVTFSDDVNIALPIGKFDLNQRSLFTGAVRNMYPNGGTAMFDGIVVASDMLHEAKQNNPNAKCMMFVLTDGETNQGSNLRNTRRMIEGLRFPIYSIGYNANIEALATISQINEAASINADTDDVIYQIQSLFNAEM